jgi:hypothetical protein
MLFAAHNHIRLSMQNRGGEAALVSHYRYRRSFAARPIRYGGPTAMVFLILWKSLQNRRVVSSPTLVFAH